MKCQLDRQTFGVAEVHTVLFKNVVLKFQRKNYQECLNDTNKLSKYSFNSYCIYSTKRINAGNKYSTH